MLLIATGWLPFIVHAIRKMQPLLQLYWNTGPMSICEREMVFVPFTLRFSAILRGKEIVRMLIEYGGDANVLDFDPVSDVTSSAIHFRNGVDGKGAFWCSWILLEVGVVRR